MNRSCLLLIATGSLALSACDRPAPAATESPNAILAKSDGSVRITIEQRAGREWLVVADEEEYGGVTCEGRDVAIVGSGNELELRGECGTIAIEGDDNAVRVDVFARLELRGDDNIISWNRGADGRAPEIIDQGDENYVRQAR